MYMKNVEIQKADNDRIYDIQVDGEWYQSYSSPRNVLDTLENLSKNDSIQIQFDGSPAGLVDEPDLDPDRPNCLEVTRSESGMFDISVNDKWLASRNSPDNIFAILADVSGKGQIQMEYNDTPEEKLNRTAAQPDLSLSEADLAGLSDDTALKL